MNSLSRKVLLEIVAVLAVSLTPMRSAHSRRSPGRESDTEAARVQAAGAQTHELKNGIVIFFRRITSCRLYPDRCSFRGGQATRIQPRRA